MYYLDANTTIQAIGLYGKDNAQISGEWDFQVNVQSNRENVVVYNIAKENEQHTIDKVIVTPVMITVYTSYPDLYSGTVRYFVVPYSDLSPNEDVSKMGEYASTSGITKIPRNRVDKWLDIYVCDRDALPKEKIDTRTNIEQHAIVSYHLELQ